MVKDRFQLQVCNIINKSVNHFSQFISVEVKKHLRKSEAQVREKLRKLRLKQNDGLLTKKCVSNMRTIFVVLSLLSWFKQLST